MNCPDCKTEMKIVFFRYENGVCFADGIRRFLCDTCGYQKLVEEIKEVIEEK